MPGYKTSLSLFFEAPAISSVKNAVKDFSMREPRDEGEKKRKRERERESWRPPRPSPLFAAGPHKASSRRPRPAAPPQCSRLARQTGGGRRLCRFGRGRHKKGKSSREEGKRGGGRRARYMPKQREELLRPRRRRRHQCRQRRHRRRHHHHHRR